MRRRAAAADKSLALLASFSIYIYIYIYAAAGRKRARGIRLSCRKRACIVRGVHVRGEGKQAIKEGG